MHLVIVFNCLLLSSHLSMCPFNMEPCKCFWNLAFSLVPCRTTKMNKLEYTNHPGIGDTGIQGTPKSSDTLRHCNGTRFSAWQMAGWRWQEAGDGPGLCRAYILCGEIRSETQGSWSRWRWFQDPTDRTLGSSAWKYLAPGVAAFVDVCSAVSWED